MIWNRGYVRDICRSFILDRESLKRASVIPLPVLLWAMVIAQGLLYMCILTGYVFVTNSDGQIFSNLPGMAWKNLFDVILLSLLLFCSFVLLRPVLSIRIDCMTIARGVILVSLVRPLILLLGFVLPGILIQVLFFLYSFLYLQQFFCTVSKAKKRSITEYTIFSLLVTFIAVLAFVRLGLG